MSKGKKEAALNEKKKMKRWKKVILWIVGIIVLIGIIAFLVLRFAPIFGGHATSEDEKDYAKRSEVFKDGHFENTGKFTVMVDTDEKDPYTISKKDTEPEDELPSVKASLEKYDAAEKTGALKKTDAAEKTDVEITWFGHSLLLIRIGEKNVLMDPMFAERSSPVSFAGPKRFSHPGIEIKELPRIDAVLISHDHYDHLDMEAIKELESKTDNYFVPLGIEKDLQKWDIPEKKIKNFAWWEETKLGDLKIACTPARHYSVRNVMDNGETLWCSWVLKDKENSLYESGDSGYGDHFKQIREKYGEFDMAILDCAQYNVKWPQVHMFPEEAAKAAKELGSKQVMPIHWGAFSLAEHGWDDPVERLVKAGEKENLTVVTPRIGETFELDKASNYLQRWWKKLK